MDIYIDYGRSDTRITDKNENMIGTLSGNVKDVAESLYKLTKKHNYKLHIDTRTLGRSLLDYLTNKYNDLIVYSIN